MKSELVDVRSAIPADLRARDQWICWRWADRADPRTGEIRRAKVPLQPATLRSASSIAPATWGPFAQAWRSWRAGDCAGIGFVLARGGGLVGVDLDHCRDAASGALTPFAARVVATLDTYTEISPSGTGLHLVGWGRKPGDRCRAADGQGAIELYDWGRTLALTGQPWGDVRPLRDCTAELAALYGELFPARQDQVAWSVARSGPLADTAILRLAGRARNGEKFRRLWQGDTTGYASRSEADLALCSILAFYSQDADQLDRLFRLSALYREKWDSVRPVGSYGRQTIAWVLARGGARFGGEAAQ